MIAGVAVTSGSAGGWRHLRRRPGALSWVIMPSGLCGPRPGARLQHQLSPSRTRQPGRSLAGWTMIEVFDTAAATSALARRMLRCRTAARARERTVRELGGALLTVRPDRARCTGCDVTHVVLDAGLDEQLILDTAGAAAPALRALAREILEAGPGTWAWHSRRLSSWRAGLRAYPRCTSPRRPTSSSGTWRLSQMRSVREVPLWRSLVSAPWRWSPGPR